MFTRDQVFAGAALKCKQIWCNLRIPNLNELVSHSRLRLSVDHPLDSQSQSSQFALIGTSLCLIKHAKSCTSPDLQLFTTSIHFLLDELRTPFLSLGKVEFLFSLEPMSHLWDSSHLRSIVCCHCILVILLDPLLNQEVRPHLFGCHFTPLFNPQRSLFSNLSNPKWRLGMGKCSRIPHESQPNLNLRPEARDPTKIHVDSNMHLRRWDLSRQGSENPTLDLVPPSRLVLSTPVQSLRKKHQPTRSCKRAPKSYPFIPNWFVHFAFYKEYALDLHNYTTPFCQLQPSLDSKTHFPQASHKISKFQAPNLSYSAPLGGFFGHGTLALAARFLLGSHWGIWWCHEASLGILGYV